MSSTGDASGAFETDGTTLSSDTPRQMTSVLFETRVDPNASDETSRPLRSPADRGNHPSETGTETATMSTHHATENESLPERPLSERDLEILAFERQWWKYAGSKEQAIKELFDMSSTRYYQVLNALLDNPAALEADPMLIKRLRRMRASRQRARTSRRLGINS